MNSKQLFDCSLYYSPALENYKSSDFTFWNDSAGEFFYQRKENEKLPGKVAAYELAKKRATEYANQKGIQIRFSVSLTDGINHYHSNTYLSKNPK